ncbi:MAG: hypothetical protein IK100_05475 [Muribaculaceae bacterium]|nr:hypothetical protein [Muribaculaceae bacterium]
MKKIFTLAMMLLCVGSMMANWQPSDTEAIRLDAEGTNGQVQMKTIRTDDGKIILSWLRGENINNVFSYQLHLQIFDAQGNALFGDEGVIVCDKRTRTWTTDYALALAPNGDILLAYTDIRNDPDEENAETYLYRYTQAGEPVWDADGILFPSGKIHENALSVEDIAPVMCVSGDNIYAAVNHTEYYMEEANENNWSPSPWFPNQPMPDSVLVNEGKWLIYNFNNDGTVANEAPKENLSKILVMQPSANGNIYLVYDNKDYGLSAEMLDANLTNAWNDSLVIEQRAITTGQFVATPITAVDEYGVLMLTYRVLSDFYGYQVINFLYPEGVYAEDPVTLAGNIDGDAGSAAMGVKEDRAMVAWEYAYSSSEYRMNVNVVDDNNFYCWEDDYMYGRTLETNSMWGYKPVAVIPVADGWVVLYGNCTSWNGANFMVVKISDEGETVWSKQICEDNFKSSGFSVVYDDKNAYIFYTQDPTYKDADGGMYVMCVDIAGEMDAIDKVDNSEEVISTEIYTIDGRRVNHLQDGVNIIRTTYKGGKVTTTKVIR